MLNIGISKWNRAEKALNRWSSKSNKDKASPELSILKAIFYSNRERLHHNIGLMFPISSFKPVMETSAIEFELEEEKTQNADDVHRLLTRIESDLESQQDIRFKLAEPDSDYFDDLAEKNKNILTGILEGNHSVFLKFYEMEFPAIVRMTLRYGGTVEDARDLFQDALVVIIEKSIHTQLNLNCELGTYLYSICRNKWTNRLRKLQRQISYDDSFDHSSDEMTIWDVDPTDNKKQENAIQIIDTLGEKCKLLLNYYYYRKMSWEEISEQLGYSSAASARNQKYKCLERIKYLLQSYA